MTNRNDTMNKAMEAELSKLKACCTVWPSEVGRDDTMLLKIRIDVPTILYTSKEKSASFHEIWNRIINRYMSKRNSLV